MNLGLNGKKAFITASSRGIGLATAEAFLTEGADVIINGRDPDRLDAAVMSLTKKYGGHASGYCGDMLRSDRVCGVAEFIEKTFEKLDILVANLGSGKTVTDNPLDADEWRRLYDINVAGTVEELNKLHPLLKKGACPCVILISSVISREAAAAPAGYAAAKSAVRALNKYLSRMWADDGIRVNCVLPGNVCFEGGRWEELRAANPDEVDSYIASAVPMKRFGKPEEIADMIVFLSSERTGFVTGSEIAVDGGQSAAI